MQAFSKFNRGVKYLLAVIDVFSKYSWLIPLKDKTGKSVASALNERKPEKMWVDKGKEFYNKDVKDLAELYSSEIEAKSSVVKRWIRTMTEKMWKYFSANSTNVYINALPDLVKKYNYTKHSSFTTGLGLRKPIEIQLTFVALTLPFKKIFFGEGRLLALYGKEEILKKNLLIRNGSSNF